jgi:hypothetical protein
MHKNATKYNKTESKWCINKHGASKIIDTFETYQRGINSQARWDDLSNKILESTCNIMCLQETKREIFDNNYIRNFCPRRLNQFEFSPSVGNSGVCWSFGMALL